MSTPFNLTLPARYYQDPAHFKKEIESFFYEKWACVGREEQISKPGDYFLVDHAGESLIVTKDESGTPRAFFNVCRHRGTRLCEKSEGSFKSRISCPYHAWSFALDGSLKAAPQMDESPGFCRDDYPLHKAHIATWDGHLWVSLAKAPVPLETQLAGVWKKFSSWKMQDLVLGKRIHYDIHANWKLIIQNYSECLHCPVIHPTLKKLSHWLSGDNEPASREYLGGCMTLNENVESMTVTGKTKRAILPGLNDHERRHVYYYWLPPNLLLSLHPDYMMTHTLWPKSEKLTKVICEFHFHPSETAKTDFDPNDAAEFWDQVNREDWHVSELSQLGIASRAYTPGPYSHREGLLHALDRYVTGEL